MITENQDTQDTSETENFGFNFQGKKKAIKEASIETNKSFKEIKDESVDFDFTQNLLIKGDNLDALKLLKKDFYQKIKVIYLDPPYNTIDGEFIYNDDFTLFERDVLQKMNLKSKLDEDFDHHNFNGFKNHSNWLSFMLSRLILAKELLSDDGLIFLSIDNNEVHHLRLLCDEVFGENNFLDDIIWLHNPAGRQFRKHGSSVTKEYILCYAKNKDKQQKFMLSWEFAKKHMPRSYSFNTLSRIKNDEHGEYISRQSIINHMGSCDNTTNPLMWYDVFYCPETQELRTGDVNSELPENFVRIQTPKIEGTDGYYYVWGWSRKKLIQDRKDLIIKQTRFGWNIFKKRRDFYLTRFKDIITDIPTVNGGTDLKELDMTKLFNFPKPVKLIKVLLNLVLNQKNEPNFYVLDLFAGSGTTAQAVMEINTENENRKDEFGKNDGLKNCVKFILVQSSSEIQNEKSKPYNFCKNVLKKEPNIFELTAERLRRAGKKVISDFEKKQGCLHYHQDFNFDTGFKLLEIV